MDKQHPLSAYRARHKIKLIDFALSVGATRQMVWRWERGSVPTRKYCEAIVRKTGGEITPTHFMLAEDRRPPVKARAPAKQEASAA